MWILTLTTGILLLPILAFVWFGRTRRLRHARIMQARKFTLTRLDPPGESWKLEKDNKQLTFGLDLLSWREGFVVYASDFEKWENGTRLREEDFRTVLEDVRSIWPKLNVWTDSKDAAKFESWLAAAGWKTNDTREGGVTIWRYSPRKQEGPVR